MILVLSSFKENLIQALKNSKIQTNETKFIMNLLIDEEFICCIKDSTTVEEVNEKIQTYLETKKNTLQGHDKISENLHNFIKTTLPNIIKQSLMCATIDINNVISQNTLLDKISEITDKLNPLKPESYLKEYFGLDEEQNYMEFREIFNSSLTQLTQKFDKTLDNLKQPNIKNLMNILIEGLIQKTIQINLQNLTTTKKNQLKTNLNKYKKQLRKLQHKYEKQQLLIESSNNEFCDIQTQANKLLSSLEMLTYLKPLNSIKPLKNIKQLNELQPNLQELLLQLFKILQHHPGQPSDFTLINNIQKEPLQEQQFIQELKDLLEEYTIMLKSSQPIIEAEEIDYSKFDENKREQIEKIESVIKIIDQINELKKLPIQTYEEQKALDKIQDSEEQTNEQAKELAENLSQLRNFSRNLAVYQYQLPESIIKKLKEPFGLIQDSEEQTNEQAKKLKELKENLAQLRNLRRNLAMYQYQLPESIIKKLKEPFSIIQEIDLIKNLQVQQIKLNELIDLILKNERLNYKEYYLPKLEKLKEFLSIELLDTRLQKLTEELLQLQKAEPLESIVQPSTPYESIPQIIKVTKSFENFSRAPQKENDPQKSQILSLEQFLK